MVTWCENGRVYLTGGEQIVLFCKSRFKTWEEYLEDVIGRLWVHGEDWARSWQLPAGKLRAFEERHHMKFLIKRDKIMWKPRNIPRLTKRRIRQFTYNMGTFWISWMRYNGGG